MTDASGFDDWIIGKTVKSMVSDEMTVTIEFDDGSRMVFEAVIPIVGDGQPIVGYTYF